MSALLMQMLPWMGSPRIFNIVFHQQKLSSLSIACDIKPCTQCCMLRQVNDPRPQAQISQAIVQNKSPKVHNVFSPPIKR